MRSKEEELSDIYKEQVASLYSYGCKFTSDRDMVKDCIHDVFVKLYEKENFHSIQNLKYYLFRSFKNRLVDELSKVSPLYTDDLSFSYLHEASGEDKYIADDKSRQMKRYIEHIFENLTDRQKEAVYLYYIEELSYETICDILNMNYQSVRNTIHRALTRLREKLGNVPPSFLFLYMRILLTIENKTLQTL
jgi:RNA polymerase sigma factor (sigma-70 family)